MRIVRQRLVANLSSMFIGARDVRKYSLFTTREVFIFISPIKTVTILFVLHNLVCVIRIIENEKHSMT